MAPFELRHLRYFLHLAEEKSFVRAARKANVSQSSMTEQLQRLEDILGVKLIERDRRHVSLTPAGEAMERKARDLLEKADDLISATQEAGGVVRQQIRIGYSEMALASRMPGIVRAFRRTDPEVKLIILHQSSVASDKALLEDRYDVLFVPSLSKSPSFSTLELGQETVVACMPADSSIALKKSVSPMDFRDSPLILPVESSRFAERVAAAFIQADVRANVVSRISRVTSMLTLVASGEASCFIPGSFSGIIPREVVARPFCKPTLKVPFSLVWRTDADNPSVARFIALARRSLQAPDLSDAG